MAYSRFKRANSPHHNHANPRPTIREAEVGGHGIGGVNRIGEHYNGEEPTLAGRFRN